MDLSKKIAHLGNTLNDVFQSIIDPKQMRELAKKTGFVKRCSSLLKGDEFVQLLIIESVDGVKNTLRGAVDTLKQIKSMAAMTKQALSQRMNTEAAAVLIESVFEKTLKTIMIRAHELIKFSNENLELLKPFSNVYIQDSSESHLDSSLAEEYKGSGGGSGNGKGDASVKIDLIYEYKEKRLSHFKVTDRRKPDVTLGEKLLEIIQKGDLVLRDLGYSCISSFQKIQELGAFFLSRLHPRLKVILNPHNLNVSLGDYLEKKAINGRVVDIMVYISDQLFQCRLIAYQAPPEIKQIREKEYLKECKKKKRQPNPEYIKRLGFTIFITNVPLIIWPSNVIGTIYRLRWQVELIFKSWKSNLGFDFLKGKNPFRIRCLIYGRLTAILMIFTVYSCADKAILELMEKEISMHKMVDWITKNGRFFGIVLKGFGIDLWNALIEDAKNILCKEKRQKRKTTRELIEQRAPFIYVTH